MFAEDVLIWIPVHEEAFNCELHVIVIDKYFEWGEMWKMEMNAEKNIKESKMWYKLVGKAIKSGKDEDVSVTINFKLLREDHIKY